MTTALAARDDLTVDGEIIEHPASAPLTLFGTTDPAAVIERASAIATALASIINERELFTRIGQKKHVQVEGWTLLGSMVGVFAEVEWSRPIDDGWEARAVARTLAGNVVGAAEAMCTAREGRWKAADPYAIRSMSQTRAVSKALRLPLGFIMHLAGYSATPAEELADEQPERSERMTHAGRRGASPSATTSAPARTPEETSLLGDLLAVPGMTVAQAELLADAVGVPRGGRANADQLRAMIARATTPASGVPTAPAQAAGEGSASPPPTTREPGSSIPPASVTAPAASSPAPSEPAPTDEELLAAAGPGAEIVPPQAGTDAYKALSAPDKAAARAYWQQHSEEPAEQMRAALTGGES